MKDEDILRTANGPKVPVQMTSDISKFMSAKNEDISVWYFAPIAELLPSPCDIG